MDKIEMDHGRWCFYIYIYIFIYIFFFIHNFGGIGFKS